MDEHSPARFARHDQDLPPASGRDVRQRSGPLAGVRVTDFCWYGVGSCATRVLADFGAQVVKIEHESHLDGIRFSPLYNRDFAVTWGDVAGSVNPDASGMFNNYCRNKLSFAVDVKSADGKRMAERLIAESDVVTENFAPGVMERLGFTYDHLRSLNPAVIYARMSGYGHSGSHADFKSFGPTVQAASGLSHISGLPGREPSGLGFSYMDNQAAYYNANAILMALLRRNMTGMGTEIDVAAVEVAATMLGPVFLDVVVNGRSTRTTDFPTGNRMEWPQAAPHGVYPTNEDDRWVAIAVFDDAQWLGLRAALGDPEWAADEAYSTQHGRFAVQDELDRLLAAWTRERGGQEIAARLQSRGVPAGAVQNARDLREVDPQVAARELFFELDHPVIGRAEFEATPIRFSTIRQDNWRSAPLVGEDNDYVLSEIIGAGGSEPGDVTGPST